MKAPFSDCLSLQLACSVFLFLSFLFIAIFRPFHFIHSISHILPLVLADLSYRLILTIFNGDILGVRQCMTVLPLDLYIAIYLLARYTSLFGYFPSSKVFDSVKST